MSRVNAVGSTWIDLERPLPYNLRLAWHPRVDRFMPMLNDRTGVQGVTIEFPFTKYPGHFLVRQLRGSCAAAAAGLRAPLMLAVHAQMRAPTLGCRGAWCCPAELTRQAMWWLGCAAAGGRLERHSLQPGCQWLDRGRGCRQLGHGWVPSSFPTRLPPRMLHLQGTACPLLAKADTRTCLACRLCSTQLLHLLRSCLDCCCHCCRILQPHHAHTTPTPRPHHAHTAPTPRPHHAFAMARAGYYFWGTAFCTMNNVRLSDRNGSRGFWSGHRGVWWEHGNDNVLSK